MAKAKNWAIVVGINAYEHIGQLRYANRDAAALRDFFQESKFDRVFCFADGLQLSPEPDQKSVQPRHSDLEDFLHDRFTTKTPPLSAGDNCWFFFAGHGKRIQDCDYLLPQDYNPRQQDPTRRALSVNFVREALLKSGADNVILLLDACRVEGDREGLGIGDEQPGAITIFSCQRNQKAYEIEALEQGAFTAALLEGLRMPKASDNCATVQRLDAHLRRRVPELCRLHPEQPVQTPATSVEPGQKWYLLLLPDVATEPDIAMLKNQAYQAATLDGNLELAEQLWIRIIAATNGQDSEALRAYAKVMNREKPLSPTPPLPQTPSAAKPSSSRSTDSQSSPPPVRPLYQRGEGHRLGPISTPNVQRAQPTSSPPKRPLPWIYLTSLGFLYAVYGMLLASISASSRSVAIAVAVAGVVEAGAETGTENRVVARTMAWISTVVLVLSVAETVDVVLVLVLAVAGFVVWAGARAGDKLLISFSRFHTFLILASTPLIGLGLEWLRSWALKAASGH